MAQPKPKPVDPSKVREMALETMARSPFPVLATVSGDEPRARPVSPVRSDGFVVYVANLRSYGKTAEIEANANVELCYMSPDHDQVRIAGRAEAVTDRALLEEIWEANPLLRSYLGSLDNPEFILYRVTPRRARFMREWALSYFDVPLERA